jgi:hypothetical protein
VPASMRSSTQKMPRELHDSAWADIKGYPSWIAGIKYPGPDGTDRGKYCARNLSAGAVLDLASSLITFTADGQSLSNIRVAISATFRSATTGSGVR